MITLNEEQLNELNQFCQELPTKYYYNATKKVKND